MWWWARSGCVPNFAAQFKEKFGVDMLEGYGCTEMGPVVAVNVPDVVHGGEQQVGHKPGTVGHPLPGVAAKVVDPESGQDLTEGQEGLLLLKGPGRMVGYLADDNATAAALRDGWYVTGDIAIIDEDGFIRITDRLSRFSKIGGEMVPHLKIEEAMLRIPGVEGACVTAVPDTQRGERLVGFYVANEAMAPQLVWQGLGDSDLPKIWIPKATDLRRIELFAGVGHRQGRSAGGEGAGGCSAIASGACSYRARVLTPTAGAMPVNFNEPSGPNCVVANCRVFHRSARPPGRTRRGTGCVRYGTDKSGPQLPTGDGSSGHNDFGESDHGREKAVAAKAVGAASERRPGPGGRAGSALR